MNTGFLSFGHWSDAPGSRTLKTDESGEPFHVQQAAQIREFREAWAAAGHDRGPGCR